MSSRHFVGACIRLAERPVIPRVHRRASSCGANLLERRQTRPLSCGDSVRFDDQLRLVLLRAHGGAR